MWYNIYLEYSDSNIRVTIVIEYISNIIEDASLGRDSSVGW